MGAHLRWCILDNRVAPGHARVYRALTGTNAPTQPNPTQPNIQPTQPNQTQTHNQPTYLPTCQPPTYLPTSQLNRTNIPHRTQPTPPKALPNGFVAAAHDVGDPWNSQGCTQNGCCRDTTPPNVSNGCSGDTRWMVKTSRLDPRNGGWVDGLVPIYPNTPHLMSSVHPR